MFRSPAMMAIPVDSFIILFVFIFAYKNNSIYSKKRKNHQKSSQNQQNIDKIALHAFLFHAKQDVCVCSSKVTIW